MDEKTLEQQVIDCLKTWKSGDAKWIASMIAGHGSSHKAPPELVAAVHQIATSLHSQGRIAIDASGRWADLKYAKGRAQRKRAFEREAQRQQDRWEEQNRRDLERDREEGIALDAEKFAKVLALLSSDKDGEVLAAACKANTMRRQAGLEWPDVLNYAEARRERWRRHYDDLAESIRQAHAERARP
jgi:hypothetical protein